MSKQRGLTLLEVLIASAVLAIALSSLLGLHARNIHLVAQANDLSEAGMLASRLVAMTRAGPWPDSGQQSGTFEESPAEGALPWPHSARRFSWQREVEDTPLAGLRRVSIAVTLDGQNHPLAELVFTTARTQPWRTGRP